MSTSGPIGTPGRRDNSRPPQRSSSNGRVVGSAIRDAHSNRAKRLAGLQALPQEQRASAHKRFAGNPDRVGCGSSAPARRRNRRLSGTTPRFDRAPSSSSVRLGRSFRVANAADLHELLRVVQALVGMKERSHRPSLLFGLDITRRSRQRRIAHCRKCDVRRNSVWIVLDLNKSRHRFTFGKGDRSFECGREVARACDRFAMPAVARTSPQSLGWLAKGRTRERVLAFLMLPDGARHAVIEHQNDDTELALRRGAKLLHGHPKQPSPA